MTDTEAALAALDEAKPDDKQTAAPDIPLDELHAPSHANLSFVTKRFALLALLEKAATVLPAKTPLPVLSDFQVEASANGLRVVATDLELSVIANTKLVQVVHTGTAVFPGRRLLDIVKEAEDGEVTIDVKDGTASIAIGPTDWQLKLRDGAEYPPMPDIGGIELHALDRGRLLRGIESVRYAICTDPVRPSLTMIDVRVGKMTATDGVRFQQIDLLGQVARKAGHVYPLDFQVPGGAVEDVVKLLRSADLDFVEVGSGPHHLIVRVAGDVFIAQKLMQHFPDMEKQLLAPAMQNKDVLVVDRSELIDAVKRVRITADPETSAVVLRLTLDSAEVASKDKFGNTAREVIDAHWVAGDRQVVVNHVFLMDMLHMAAPGPCRFFLGEHTKTKKSPILLRDDAAEMVGICQQMRADWVL